MLMSHPATFHEINQRRLMRISEFTGALQTLERDLIKANLVITYQPMWRHLDANPDAPTPKDQALAHKIALGLAVHYDLRTATGAPPWPSHFQLLGQLWQSLGGTPLHAYDMPLCLAWGATP